MLSKDLRFENSGIGVQTRISYSADFQYYKRRLIELYHSPDSSDWVQDLLATWDFEVFLHHNKQKGHTLDDENAETIDIDMVEADVDASEIAEDKEMLRLWAAQRQNSTPNANNSDAVPAGRVPPPIPLNEINGSDYNDPDDIYGDEAPLPPLRPIASYVPAALTPSPSSGSSDSDDAPNQPSILPSKSLPRSSESNNIIAPTRFRQATLPDLEPVDDSDGLLPSDSDLARFTGPANTLSSVPAVSAALPKPLPTRKRAPAKKPAAVLIPRVTRQMATANTSTLAPGPADIPPNLIDNALPVQDSESDDVDDQNINAVISGSQPEIAKAPAAAKPKRGRAAGSKKSTKG